MIRTLTTLAAIGSLTAMPVGLQECETGPTFNEGDFAVVIDTCVVTTDGRPSREDVDNVYFTIGDNAEYVQVHTPVSCLETILFNTVVTGTHVDVIAEFGCGGGSPTGDIETAELGALSFDGVDTDGDGVIDHIDGEVTLSWFIEEVIGPAVIRSEEVVCTGRPFVGDDLPRPE